MTEGMAALAFQTTVASLLQTHRFTLLTDIVWNSEKQHRQRYGISKSSLVKRRLLGLHGTINLCHQIL